MRTEARWPWRRAARHDGGFILLEVLIAFAIAAVALSVLLHTALAGLVSTRNAGVYEAALATAQSHLAAAGRIVGGDGVSEGRDGPFLWRVEIAQEAEATPPLGPVNWPQQARRPRARLYRVSARVEWRGEGRSREVRLETQRLGFLQPPGPGP